MEEFRDHFKNSNQSNDYKLHLNGCTYRKIKSKFNHSKVGNIIQIEDHMDELKDFIQKYGISIPYLDYSLDKKKDGK